MDAKYIAKPTSSVSWNTVSPVERQYITSTLTTLTYSTTGVMSNITNTTYTTTARGTVITSNVSYSYNIGTLYDTSFTSTTVSLPDGRTVTSFGSLSTTLKYSYYPNRKQTGEKYVAVSNNYVGDIYSTIGSSSRGTCILFGGEVNSTINTYRSSIYTPAYTVDTTAGTSTSTVATITKSRNVFSFIATSEFVYFSTGSSSTRQNSSTTVTYSRTGSTPVYVSNYTPDANGFHLNFMTASWEGSSSAGSIGRFYLVDWNPVSSPRISFTFIAGTNYSIADQTITTAFDARLISETIITNSSSSIKETASSTYYYSTANTWMSFENPVISLTYTENSTTMLTVNTTSIIVPEFDGLVSAHNIADSMYYSIHYTYPFSESKTTYILHSDSITHQYYVSTTKEVRV